MPKLPFVTVDVFTSTRFAGNPLAIVRVPKNHDISTQQMQTIAREFNLSETIFLFPNTSGDARNPEHRVRIFLVNIEVPFAGHPTIGTACLQSRKVGELGDLKALSQIAVTGVKPDPRLDDDFRSEGFAGSYWYVVLSDPRQGKQRDGEKVARLRTRMVEGAFEDPATGSAACALTSFLALKWRVAKTVRFEITQAVEIGRQSDIGVVVTLKNGLDAVEKVELSGTATKVMEGMVEYDDDQSTRSKL